MTAMKLMSTYDYFKVGAAEIRGNQYRVFTDVPATLADFFTECAKHGDDEFIIDPENRLSYAETWARSCRLANALKKKYNIKEGQRIAIAMRNYPEWCMIYMAISALGAVSVPLNSWWRGDELHFALNDCGAKFVFCDSKRFAYLQPYRDELNLTLIGAREKVDGADDSYEALLASEESTTPPTISTKTDDDFSIVYTSGSTGDPKGGRSFASKLRVGNLLMAFCCEHSAGNLRRRTFW